MELQAAELLALQEIDTRLGRLNTEIAALDDGKRVELALGLRRMKLEAAEKRCQALQSEQRAAELELKALEEKKHQEARKLYEGRITNPRELQLLQQEIEMLNRMRTRLDEQILRRFEEMEAAEKMRDTARAQVEEGERALRIVRRRYEKEKTRIEEEMGRLYPERERLAQVIEADTLRRYDQIKHRNHNIGAVRIENGACGGCRMKVGTALLRRVKANDRYVYCESCSRFLFPSLEDQEAAAAAPGSRAR